MRAAILRRTGAVPEVGDFDAPEGDDVVEVRLAGVNPVDLMLASGAMGEVETPAVVGQEGIGVTDDGRRVYFNAASGPFGSWAQRSRLDPSHAYPVPDEVDDELAVACGIAGLAAWLSLTRHAQVGGQNVLVLGATGTVGQIAVQAARILGAGRIVAAGRDPETLEQTRELGADATVTLGAGDDASALSSEAGHGYEVVLDIVYGAPFLAALQATSVGATLVTVGAGAGDSAEIPFAGVLQGRTHVGHGNPLMPASVVRDGYAELVGHAARGEIRVPTRVFDLEQAADAWRAQQDGPHVKLTVAP